MDCADTTAPTCADAKMLDCIDCLYWPGKGNAYYVCPRRPRLHYKDRQDLSDCDIPGYNDKPAFCATE